MRAIKEEASSQLKVNIRVERKRRSSEDFAEKWMTVARQMRENGPNLKCHLELYWLKYSFPGEKKHARLTQLG